MTTLQPRGPYSNEELEKLYPHGLQLELVQVLLRHGERSPVSARFQNVQTFPYSYLFLVLILLIRRDSLHTGLTAMLRSACARSL